MNTKFKSQGLVGKKIPKKLIEVGQGDSLCQKGKLDSTALLFTLRKWFSPKLRTEVQDQRQMPKTPWEAFGALELGKNIDKSRKEAKNSTSAESGVKLYPVLVLTAKGLQTQWSSYSSATSWRLQLCLSKMCLIGDRPSVSEITQGGSHAPLWTKGGKSFLENPDHNAVIRNQKL